MTSGGLRRRFSFFSPHPSRRGHRSASLIACTRKIEHNPHNARFYEHPACGSLATDPRVETCFEERGVPGKEIDKITPAFRHIEHVSHPTLRKALP
ncbi:hypothetical protein Bcep18194_A6274 [Burkholderia lata]|uniref:Uncharacterized protein n=1 Tax=Burkholderia lata (strain ATCC 17760 / DSM 23089 / LMG 22485 / NCIMB 9086 / R18194 / 383) TaxID=482957 RepID=Q39CE8_BURL3|nr:hypothetical protein Bcep18194_A6274 [Burkholderia lata]